MAQPYFRAENLAVGYRRKAVAEGIQLDIQKGEIVALIGPNGAGKSTLLKTIVRELPPIRGRMILDGRDLKDYSYRELSKKMAVILTQRIKVELTTCRDIVASGRYPYTGHLGVLRPEDEEKVDAALEAVHAEELAWRDFHAISDGQRQRILLARAICQEPELILLDEPTSFLDVRHKLDLLTTLTRMARQKGITVIMSLHEIDLAEKVADRVITLRGGSEFCFGTPGEIFQEERIRELYEIENGYFDPLFGSIELKKPQGNPRVFVIAGGGEGIQVFRALQRENIPFAAGVLYENDLDYRLARLLAAEAISAPAFGSMPEEAVKRAEEIMVQCERVLLAGPLSEKANPRLAEAARRMGKLTA
ncbi:MAG: ABC transporter ATP-binding protein [Faecousia sp.]